MVSFARFLVDLDNSIEQVCLRAQIARGRTSASNDRNSFEVGAYRVMLHRVFPKVVLLHAFSFRFRAVSFDSLSTI